MAFWPFSRAYVQTGLDVFLPIGRPHAWSAFLARNAWPVMREVAILLPLAAAIWWWRSRNDAPRPAS
jgi:hypothetical protein